MTELANRWAFVVPGESIAVRNPALVKLLGQAGKPWEDFIYLATAEVLGYLNRQGLTEFQDGVNFLIQEATRHTQPSFHSAQIEEIVIGVMEGLDLVEEDTQPYGLGGLVDVQAEKQYAVLCPAVIHVLEVMVQYITLMFTEPHEPHGTPYEITLDRLLGKDMVFSIAYM